MKYMVASDIHGSAYYCEKLMAAFEKEEADKLLLLGDLLYHGPRNALPKEYDPPKVCELLNRKRDKIVAVRGNCDAEVDQMVLEFPMMADYLLLRIGDRNVYASHGHIINQNQPLPFQKGDVLLCGHTHIPAKEEYESFTYMNPGSVSIPKQDSHHGYMIITEEEIMWKDLDGNTVEL